MRLSGSVFLLGLIFFGRNAVAQEQITLEQVVALALEKNYDVLLIKNSAQASSTDNSYANAAFLPSLNATGSKLWNKNNQKQILANDSLVERNGVRTENLQGSVQLIWTLFDGTKMFALRERIAEQEVRGLLNVKDQMVNTISAVIVNYYNVVRQKQQWMALQEQISVNEERVKLATRKLEVGVGGKPELLQAKVDLNAQRTSMLQQETIIAQLKDLLNGLVGQQLPTNFDVADSIAINLNLQQSAIQSAVSVSNYSLLSAKEGVSIARLSLRERTAEKFPVINFVSAYNFSRRENSLAINQFTPLFDQNRGFNYGFSATLPIFNGFNNRRLVQQARLNVARTELLYEQLKLNVDIGIRNAFVNYDNAKKVLLIEEENILLAKENVVIALESFKRGIATFIELRTAQQSLADGYNRLITARYNAKIAETELLRLNGGLLK